MNMPALQIQYVVPTDFKRLLLAFIQFIFYVFAIQLNSSDIIVCYDNSSEMNPRYNEAKVVDISVGSTIHLWCHYCHTKGNFYSRLWFFRPRAKSLREVTNMEIQTNNFEDKFTISIDHTLHLKYFNLSDSGLYTCKSYGSEIPFISYVLDAVMNIEVSPKVGPVHKWQEYKRNYIDSINKQLELSERDPFKTFRNNYNGTLTIYTVWDNWSDCKEIDGHQRGIRKRLGRCRIHPVINKTLKRGPATYNVSSSLLMYLTDGYDIPCRSIYLNKTVPELSRIIRKIPEFEADEVCPASSKSVIRKKNKIKKEIYQVIESSPVTFMCAEGMQNTDLKWYKEKEMLKYLYANMSEIREGEPHLSIDANNSLHILHISKNEEGNYTCAINGQNIKQFEVKVISKSKLLNQEFIRYSIYLAFVLSLTMTCYCTGVCVAWHRRASFADPLKLYKKKCNRLNCEQDSLLAETYD